jgi:hypothetical protein
MLFTTYMLPKGALCVKAVAFFAQVFVLLDGSILEPLFCLPPDDEIQDGLKFVCVWSTCLLLGAARARIF